MSKAMSASPSNTSLLAVEDSDDDYEALSRAFASLAEAPTLSRAVTAEECLERLEEAVEGDRGALPGIILLDLNLPGMDGRELLRHLKAHPVLRTIPVVILTTSSNPDDVSLCYAQRANAYHAKPEGSHAMRLEVGAIVNYWCSHVTLHTSH